MTIIWGDVTEQNTSEVDLFGSIMQQNVIENKLNRENAPLATIQPSMAIEFTVKGANDLYLDLNKSRLHIFAKITKADGTNIDANTAASIKLTLHSMFREIGLEINNRNVGDTSQLYLYGSPLGTLRNFCKKTQEMRLVCEGWTKDTTRHINVTAVGGNNAGLNARAETFARSIVVKFICRPHLDVFNQECLIPPNKDLHMKFSLSPNNFVRKLAEPGQGTPQENYKLLIQSINLIIHTKKLTSRAHGSLKDLLVQQSMRHHLSRFQMKQLSIPANQTSINWDNVVTCALPDLVIVGLVSDADLVSG